MKKEDLQKVNSICKQAYVRGLSTQFMLKGASADSSVKLVKLAQAKLDKLEKIASYRKEVIKQFTQDSIKG